MGPQTLTCAYCGGTELFCAKQGGHGAVYVRRPVFKYRQATLCHWICKRCGTVVRSFVEEPERLYSLLEEDGKKERPE